MLSRPVAVVVASPEGVRVEPVIDLTKLALAGLTAVGFMVGMMFRMSHRRTAFPRLTNSPSSYWEFNPYIQACFLELFRLNSVPPRPALLEPGLAVGNNHCKWSLYSG